MSEHGLGELYDYIVVGAGSAGCVLAARLSEDPANRVLLLEAGPPDDAVDIRMPAKMVALFRSAVDWNFLTEPQPSAGARQVAWPLGKTLGGSSSTNAMIYIKGSPADFDGWRDDYGCTGWGYDDLLPYFDRVHAQLGVTRLRYKDRLTRAWVAAAARLGLRDVGDFPGVTEDGVGYFSVNQRRGRRWSTADAYLRPALSRPNLTVRTGALVSRIEITGGRATGVSYRWRGREVTDSVAREVILSAGAVCSPQLLLLSGVGPREQLARHGVPLVLDVPSVGAGLQDHPRATAVWRMTGAPRRNWLAGIRWRLFGRGPYASNGGEVGTFIRTRDGLDAPDIEFMTCPPSILDQGAPPSVAVLVVGIEVHSRGAITLASADPSVAPAIDPGYLTDPRDLEALARGVEYARRVAAQAPFAPLVEEETLPGAAVPDGEQLRDWVRENVVTMHHPTSSCAMGGSESAVCDPSLRVRGVAGLRVVDASVMPTVPRGNTNAPTIAIAERAAELILSSDQAPTGPPPTRPPPTRKCDPMTKSVLFVLTSNAALGDTGRETGYWLAEAAHPWKVFSEAGYTIDLASIKGGLPPVEGVELDDPDQVAFLAEPALQNTLVLADVDPAAYDAVLYVGGHGSMWDFPGNPDISRIGAAVYDRGGVLAAVCHGPAALLDIRLADGSYLLDGKAVTSFSNAEEAEISLDVVVPFLLQDALVSRGASYSDNGIFQPSVVVSDRLVTGQNPPSADGVAREVLRLLR